MWPIERECDAFYGNPRGRNGQANPAWVAANIINVQVPFPLFYAGTRVTTVTSHRLCADALRTVLRTAWDKIGRDAAKLHALHMDVYSGGFNYRPKRTSHDLSMHSYGCAWDWDAPNNRLGQRNAFFTADHPLIASFLEQGATWGGTFRQPADFMHVQFSRVR